MAKTHFYHSYDRDSKSLQEWLIQTGSQSLFAMVAEQQSTEHVAFLQEVAKQQNISLFGAVFPEVIFAGDFRQNGFVLVGFDKPLSHSLSPPDDLSAIKKLAETSDSKELSTIFFVFDALIPNIGSILDSLYLDIGDDIHYIGVNSGSETFQPMPCLFDNTKLVEQAVLAIRLPGDKPAFLEHGYTAPEQMITATSSSGNRITSIDWRPAFEVYAEQVKKHYDVDITPENFYELAVHFPFGIVRMDNQILVRIPVSLQDDGSLFCVGEIPDNALLTLLEAEPVETKDAVNTLIASLKNSGIDRPILFYCAGRKMHKKEAALYEIMAIDSAIPGYEVIGALSLGEIGNSRHQGYPLFHNATLVSFSLD